MTERDHHLLCLGVMAGIWREENICQRNKLAIEQAVESAQDLGLPVSVERLRNGEAICTNLDN